MPATKEKTTLTIDRDVKREATALLAQMGIGLSAFVEMGLRQVVADRRLPFTPSLPSEAPRRLGAEEVMHTLDSLAGSLPENASQALASIGPDEERLILEGRLA